MAEDKIILLIEKMDGMPCPNRKCNGKLEYIAYTAFNCHTCKLGYKISPIVLHQNGKPISMLHRLSRDDYI